MVELCEIVEELEPRRTICVPGTSCVEDFLGGRAGDGCDALRVGRGGGPFRDGRGGDFEAEGAGVWTWSRSTGGGGRRA